ncbi:hypothetical protein, partial [Vibrio atlanticus]|uniref:hypothetical protein n=1 Tax=Vibrio atlanticus TaxID=693153 RepID=UPI00355277BE
KRDILTLLKSDITTLRLHFCLEFINTRLRTSFDINKTNNDISKGDDDEFDKVWSGIECFLG